MKKVKLISGFSVKNSEFSVVKYIQNLLVVISLAAPKQSKCETIC